MKKQLMIGLALSLLATGAGAAEHPKEHPTAAPGPQQGKPQEHPQGHEHPLGSKAWTKQMSREFTKAVEDYVGQKSAAAGGAFKVHDDKLGKDWALKLVGVHKKRVAHLGDQHFFACADFKSVEKGSKDKVDLDFYAAKTGAEWKIDKVLIHKVNGQPRYTYNDKNEMVPVK